MWILSQKCYDDRLVEQKKKEASERNNPEQGGTMKSCQRSSRDLEGMKLLITAKDMKLIFIV